jgi:hypothetical protein
LRVSKKGKGFNTPFAKLAAVKLPEKPKPAPPPPPPPPVAALAAPEKRDDEVFADEMRGVAQLPPDPRGRVLGGVAAPPPSPRSRRRDDESEAYAVLADLVDGAGAFDTSATDE